MNRRDFLASGAGTAGAAAIMLLGTKLESAHATGVPPQDLLPSSPIFRTWNLPVNEIAQIDLSVESPDLTRGEVQERHRIYCLLLMKLIQRFWNGNKRGPIGLYPQRANQIESSHGKVNRYRGDRGADVNNADPGRLCWDRYLGHNIACIAVDGNGDIIDFDFNHNDFFRSSAEHAEARLVRRLFSLTDIMDNWKTGAVIPGKSRAFSLTEVTIYTSLESCAQCSGMMSLGLVKQVVFLQHDPGAYRIGNIMYNLAGRDPNNNAISLAPLPVPADAVGLPHLADMDKAYKAFADARTLAKNKGEQKNAFFVSDLGVTDYAPSITSFLCTDEAFDIFSRGASEFDTLTLTHPPSHAYLDKARLFYSYADVEGFRGSPHKL